jgi:hypothetical protein
MPRTLGHESSACQLKRLILELICRGQARMVMGDGRGEVHMDRRSAIALRTSFDAKVHAGFESGAWRRKQILRELHGPHSPASLSKPEVAKNPLDESAGPRHVIRHVLQSSNPYCDTRSLWLRGSDFLYLIKAAAPPPPPLPAGRGVRPPGGPRPARGSAALPRLNRTRARATRSRYVVSVLIRSRCERRTQT